jgi:predicted amidohydrolase
MSFCGLSAIIGPDGYPLLEGGSDEEGVFLTNIEPSVIAAVRKENPVLEDRRPELYSAPILKIQKFILYKLFQLM